MRGRRGGHGGNTPTGVGKTALAPVRRTDREKHPHGRGEDLSGSVEVPKDEETPPRAWGRRLNLRRCWLLPGNTPTGVGKTPVTLIRGYCTRKHPHGRGEDEVGAFATDDDLETPPRAWGRLCAGHE